MGLTGKRIINLALVLFFVFAGFSCSLNDFQRERSFAGQEGQAIYPESIKEESILPEARQYYANLSRLALWYSQHPSYQYLPTFCLPEEENTVLRKLQSIVISDSTGKAVSFFDLDKAFQEEFLTSWAKTESFGLSQKLEKDTAGVAMQLFVERNRIFDETFSTLKSAEWNTDPFFSIKKKMASIEQTKIAESPDLPTLKSGEPTDDNFWATVVANGLMSFSVIQAAPNKLSAQTFVDRIRPNIKKGRLLVALPGGWTTTSLIVFYPNKLWYDVGHVAIVSKDADEIPDSIGYTFELSVGTGVEETHIERVGERWCEKHGLAFLCQIRGTRWETYKDGSSGKWKWRKIVSDIDGEALVEKAMTYIGVEYCSTLEVFVSKWVAPKTFICSSLAWYCAREISDIDISDWWSTSVYPVDVLFNENIQIIDNTLH